MKNVKKLLVIFTLLIIGLTNSLESPSQSITLGFSSFKKGAGLTFKGENLIFLADAGVYGSGDNKITAYKTGIGLSVDSPEIYGTCDELSLDIILCRNYYSKEPPVHRRDFTVEIGFHILPKKEKITSSFHYDVINCHGRIGIGINLNKIKMKKQINSSYNLLELDESKEIIANLSLEKEQKELIRKNPYNYCFPI